MIVMVQLGIYFEEKSINSELSIANYMVFYGLSFLGIILVLSCFIRFIVLGFNAYGKLLAKILKKIFKSKKVKKNSSNKSQSGLELDSV